jgi:hypothetical protein
LYDAKFISTALTPDTIRTIRKRMIGLFPLDPKTKLTEPGVFRSVFDGLTLGFCMKTLVKIIQDLPKFDLHQASQSFSTFDCNIKPEGVTEDDIQPLPSSQCVFASKLPAVVIVCG